MTPESADTDSAAPPRWVRACVWTFLTVFVVCALARIEAWPFTGWQLFSHARTEEQRSWFAADGYLSMVPGQIGASPPRPIRWEALGSSFRGYTQILQRFGTYPPERQDEICSAWANAQLTGVIVPRILIYETVRHVGARDGRRAQPATSTLRFVCDSGRVEEVE